MKKLWIKKFSSFKEAQSWENQYQQSKTPSSRIDEMQLLREINKKLLPHTKKNVKNRKGLRRTIKLIQPA